MAGGVAQGAMLSPMDMVPHHLDRLSRDRPITIYCAAGEQDGVYYPAAQREVICIEGGTLRARVMDDHGFWVERVVAVGG